MTNFDKAECSTNLLTREVLSKLDKDISELKEKSAKTTLDKAYNRSL